MWKEWTVVYTVYSGWVGTGQTSYKLFMNLLQKAKNIPYLRIKIEISILKYYVFLKIWQIETICSILILSVVILSNFSFFNIIFTNYIFLACSDYDELNFKFLRNYLKIYRFIKKNIFCRLETCPTSLIWTRTPWLASSSSSTIRAAPSSQRSSPWSTRWRRTRLRSTPWSSRSTTCTASSSSPPSRKWATSSWWVARSHKNLFSRIFLPSCWTNIKLY